MNGGIFVNLFEIQVPDTIQIYSQTWGDSSTRENFSHLYPLTVYRDNEQHKLFVYGELASEHNLTEEGFALDTINTQETPKLISRFLLDAITGFLQTQDYELARRPYTSFKREVVNKDALKTFFQSLAVFQAYNVQVMYLNLDDRLKYFLVVTPKLQQEFVIPLERITNKVDCTGRFVKITCPADCTIFNCELHRWRGKLAGRFDGFEDNGFRCKYYETQTGEGSYVTLQDARLEVNVPTQVCHLEASLANIRYVFEGVFDKQRVNDLIRQIRVISGDLQHNRGVANLEVGRKRYRDCVSFVERLSAQFKMFDVELSVSASPLRAVEGVPISENDLDYSIEEEDDDDYGDIPF